MATVCSLLISCCLLQWSAGVGSVFAPVIYPVETLPSSSQCGQSDPQQDEQLLEVLNMVQQQLPPPGCYSPRTCKDILRCNSSASSGYYQIQAANGSAVQVYCDMEGTNCGGEGGWMRVAHLNMTDPSSQCPDNFILQTVNNKRFCIRNTTTAGCGAMLIGTFGLNYSRVCGYAHGYSFGSPDAFMDYGRGPNQPLSGNYMLMGYP